MKEGPSESVCRNRLQTTVSCCNAKACGGERYGKAEAGFQHVWIRETNASEPLMKHRKLKHDIETGDSTSFRDQRGGNLLTGHAVSGV